MLDLLIIAGSPRKKGNTDILTGWVEELSQTKNLKSKSLFLRDYHFSHCIACGGCTKTGKCVLKDDMQGFYPLIEEAKKIIFIGPIYFQSLGALQKAFIDRFQAYWHIKFIQKIEPFPEGKKVYSLFCGGTNFKDTFTCADKIIKIASLHISGKYLGGTFLPNMDEKGDVLKDTQTKATVLEAITQFLNA